MIDLHTHSLFSDGELIPAELTRRAAHAGYRALAITDHADRSMFDLVIPRVARVVDELGRAWGLTVLAGVELTHVPPGDIAASTAEAREYGAALVVCHGETLVEPVAPGTNRAAIEAGVDILAHPGLLSAEDARLAAERGVCLELSARKGHSLSNGHVAALARATGAKLVINSDAHAPGDLVPLAMARKVALGAGLSEEEFEQCRRNAEELVARALRSREG